MKSFASNLINTIFKRISARPAAARRRATLGFEPLEMRAVLSTVMPSPTTAADDVIVDGQVITGENYDSARAGSGGGGAGKVQVQDIRFGTPIARTSFHSGSINVLLGDGSARSVSNSVPTLGTLAVPETRAGGHGSGGGTGKVAMRDFSFSVPSGAGDGFADIIVGAGVGPAGHVKVFDGTSQGEIRSFFAFQGFIGGGNVEAATESFRGGISVAAGDVGDSAGQDDGGHGTHVAGTIGAAGGAGASGGHVKVIDGRKLGGVNAVLGDGSVRFVRDSVPTLATWAAAETRAGTHGSGGGGGAGKVAMHDTSFSMPGGADDGFDDIIVGAGTIGHVKVFDGTAVGQVDSFFAFGGGFHGGVNVASASAAPSSGNRGQLRAANDDISFSAPAGDPGHGTHVAGTIGSYGRPAVGVGTPVGSVTFFDSGVSTTGSTKVAVGVIETGIDYSHPDLYKNIWINQDLERLIDDLASDVAGQHASPQRG